VRRRNSSDKKPVWQWPYSALGNNKPSGVLTTTTENGQTGIKGTKPGVDFPLRDPGQYEDEETGMRHNMHRTYAQKLGRFPQPDPIGMAGGLNRFVYGENSPFMNTDPMGLQPIAGGAGAGGAAGGLGGLGGLGGMGGGSGGSKGGYDPKTDRFNPSGTLLPLPSWLEKLLTPKTALERCEQECEDQYDLDMDECRAYSAMTGDKYTYVACKKGG